MGPQCPVLALEPPTGQADLGRQLRRVVPRGRRPVHPEADLVVERSPRPVELRGQGGVPEGGTLPVGAPGVGGPGGDRPMVGVAGHALRPERDDDGRPHLVEDRQQGRSAGLDADPVELSVAETEPPVLGDACLREALAELALAERGETLRRPGSRVIGAMLATKGGEFVQKLKSQDITLHGVSGRAILDMVISGELRFEAG